MFRNREVRYGFLILVLSGVLFGSAVFGASREAFLWFAAFFAAAAAVFLAVNFFRYRRLRRLSIYLRQVLNGERGLSAPDNAEGELSLLQNDIYKLVTRLDTQAGLLKADKRYLADSLSDISHQLKTPMTSMMVMTELLRDETVTEETRREFMRTIRSQLERMEWLLNALLKMSKLDAGTVRFHPESIQAGELIRRAAEHLLIPMELKGQEFKIEAGEELSAECDAAWTAEALSNIIKNCMEHTPEGGRITVSCQERGLYFQITVEDNGEGISPEELPHIFERFYKGKNSGKDSVGIGLAMAKNIINSQGGRIWAESCEGAGARFILRLYRKVI